MSSAGTTHGTGYFYDERVPVLLFGAGIKPGKYWGTASPADLSPTLAALCGITMARPDGRVLSEALAAPSAAPTPTSAQRRDLVRASLTQPSPSRERAQFFEAPSPREGVEKRWGEKGRSMSSSSAAAAA